MAEKIQFFVLDVTYKVIEDIPNIFLYGKTLDGRQICVVDKSFKPYFYVFLNSEDDIAIFEEKIKKIEVEQDDYTSKVTDSEVVEKSYLGQKRKAVKIFTKLPKDVPIIRNTIKDWDMINSINEYDIPFARRYLIDKQIIPLNLVEVEGEFINLKSKVPVLEASSITNDGETLKNPKILSFDIETYNPLGKRFVPEEHPIIMIAFCSEGFKKVITWKKFKTNDKIIEFVNGEADLIERFKEIIEEQKPDIITGYFSDGFDFPYLITRAKKYKIALDIGLDYNPLSITRGRTQNIHIVGLVHLDVFRFISKNVGKSLETDTYDLDSVAAELLNENKHSVDLDNLPTVWDSKIEELEKYCKYNLQDAELTYRLAIKLLPQIGELVKIIGLPIYDVTRMAFSQMVEWYILRRVQEFNEIAPNKPYYNEISERKSKTYKGAFVFEPIPGLYKNIAVFDFRSLYPSIISSHNIGLDTLNCGCCKDSEKVPDESYWFCKNKRGFIPQLVEELITRRLRVKEMIKEKPDVMLDARSQSLKLLSNAFYGYLGFYASRWYCIECTESITAYGRYYINQVIEKANNEGFKVLYADTDSIFLCLEGKSSDDALSFVEKINKNLPEMMELEHEGFYPSGIFVSAKEGPYGAKKRYALLDEDGFIKIKGFETVRRNVSFIAKKVQEQVLNIVLKENNPDKAVKYVRKVIQKLRDKEIDNSKVVIFTQISKDLSDYEAVGPHVAVAKMLKAKGVDIGPGSLIKFIITQGGGIIRDRARIPEDINQGDYDAEYYIKHQIIPSVEKIFEVLGFSKNDLLEDKDQSKLGSFF